MDRKITSGFAAADRKMDDVRLQSQTRSESRPRQSAEFQRSRYANGEFEEKKVYNRIFVGGLNETINEDDLRALFGKFGDIKEVQLKDRGAKKDETRRGHGFITYKNKEQAAVALREGRGEVLEIRGIKLNVCQAIRRVGKQLNANESSQLYGRSGSTSPPPSHGLMNPVVPPAFGHYPGMMPPPPYAALNPYNLHMLNTGYGMGGYGWPYYSNPMYGCPSISPTLSSDPSCVNCCDMYSDHSGTETAQSSPEQRSRDRPDCFGRRLSAFAESSGYIAMPDDRGESIMSSSAFGLPPTIKGFNRDGMKGMDYLREEMDSLVISGHGGGVSRFSHSRSVGEDPRAFQHHTPRSNTRR